jgi:CheY-like chemotaxis protein
MLELNEVVVDMEKMLRRLIGEDIELSTALSPERGQVKANSGHIEQVIMNLVVNARDAMPNGGQIIIETANVELDETYAQQHLGLMPGAYVMLAVSDTGCGMDAETQSHIFEPFFTTKTPEKGTGLGLSTVYGIVKQCGGQISVYSEIGRGTTFKIYLPRIAQVTAVAKRESTPLKTPRGAETILLVEDEDVVRDLTRLALVKAGYTVLEAHNGEAALQVCERYEGPIHLMLTDVVMPKMGGGELAERMALLHPATKIIYMTAYTDKIISHHGVVGPVTTFLQKPFTKNALLLKVREALDAN